MICCRSRPIKKRRRIIAVEPFDNAVPREARSLIRLKGCWLRDAGFVPGMRVAVLVEHGRLTVVPKVD